MKKKFLIVLVLAMILATGTAFADHPDGLGIGPVFTGGVNWGGGWGGPGLSLKIPGIPIFWGLTTSISSDHFGAGILGDYYFIHNPLAPEINIHWYLGLGGWFNFFSYNNSTNYLGRNYSYSYTSVAFGIRAPIGLSWQPFDWFEVFMDVALSLGLYIESDGTYRFEGRTYTAHEGKTGFAWSIPFSVGARFWF